MDGDGVVRLLLEGELDIALTHGVACRIAELRVAATPTRLDLSLLSFIDSTGRRRPEIRTSDRSLPGTQAGARRRRKAAATTLRPGGSGTALESPDRPAPSSDTGQAGPYSRGSITSGAATWPAVIPLALAKRALPSSSNRYVIVNGNDRLFAARCRVADRRYARASTAEVGSEPSSRSVAIRRSPTTRLGLLGDDTLRRSDRDGRTGQHCAARTTCVVAGDPLLPGTAGADGQAHAEIVLAGDPPAYHVQGGTPRPVGRPGPLLGAWKDARWEASSVSLQPGDQLVLYTDGVTDTTGEHGRFGGQRLAGARQGASARGSRLTTQPCWWSNDRRRGLQAPLQGAMLGRLSRSMPPGPARLLNPSAWRDARR